ncbi:hypothetical protein [Streptomyces sp. NPDC094049]|uniref:hypothetical protein n=1 Tax=Streptomyces sp. NPDC094049 TaxID=3154987 RepID=UPI003317808E
MNAFPGYRPLRGNEMVLTSDTATYRITGDVVIQGVLRDGRGYVQLTLPGISPEQLADLTSSQVFLAELYADGTRIYTTPGLVVVDPEGKDVTGQVVVAALA